jgi:hypothetical protein
MQRDLFGVKSDPNNQSIALASAAAQCSCTDAPAPTPKLVSQGENQTIS